MMMIINKDDDDHNDNDNNNRLILLIKVLVMDIWIAITIYSYFPLCKRLLVSVLMTISGDCL